MRNGLLLNVLLRLVSFLLSSFVEEIMVEPAWVKVKNEFFESPRWVRSEEYYIYWSGTVPKQPVWGDFEGRWQIEIPHQELVTVSRNLAQQVAAAAFGIPLKAVFVRAVIAIEQDSDFFNCPVDVWRGLNNKSIELPPDFYDSSSTMRPIYVDKYSGYNRLSTGG